PELVLMNLEVQGGNGLRTLQQARELHPELKVIMFGPSSDARSAAMAVRMGALDYISEPVEQSELQAVLQQHLHDSTPQEQPMLTGDSEIVDLGGGNNFVCACPAMKQIYNQAQVIAKFDIPVLMLGQSGTGKEV